MDEVLLQEVLNWNLEAVLPKHIGDFQLKPLWSKKEKEYEIFEYSNLKKGWRIIGLYEEETKDFMIKYDLGLLTITEIQCIFSSFDKFKEMLEKSFLEVIEDRWYTSKKVPACLLERKGIMSWDYKIVLPSKIGGFSLLLEPKDALSALNGSYLLALYADDSNESGLMLFYNTYRNEFFAEIRRNNVLELIHDFDEKNIQRLDKLLHQKLADVLQKISKN